ncbi:MAG: CRISPR-associated protein Cas4 [Candidatus Wallbacteria bacterium]|nr:CRISPR-associated protein Cas4 [Candidatus Wallbacteria bacterium]
MSSNLPDITATEFNYFHICQRKLWLFSHDIEMERESDAVLMGKLIHENSYQREKKEILIDGLVKIDFMDGEGVHEVKKSDSMEDAHVWQVLYYVYILRKKGVEVNKGVINYPKQKRTVEIEYTPEKEAEIERKLVEVEKVRQSQDPPATLVSKICRKCAYEEFCFA